MFFPQISLVPIKGFTLQVTTHLYKGNGDHNDDCLKYKHVQKSLLKGNDNDDDNVNNNINNNNTHLYSAIIQSFRGA